MSNEVSPDSPVTVSEASASSADPPSGTTETVASSLPGAWNEHAELLALGEQPPVERQRLAQLDRRHLERRQHGAVVGRPRLVLAVDVRSADLADQLAGLRDGRAAGVQVVDPVAEATLVEVGVAVGEAGVLDRVGVDLAERVAQPDVEQRLADRPRDGLVTPFRMPIVASV